MLGEVTSAELSEWIAYYTEKHKREEEEMKKSRR